MCEDCGCEEGNKREWFGQHGEGHSHGHSHASGNADSTPSGAPHKAPLGGDSDHQAARTIVLGQRVLARNDELAAQNRQWLQQRGVVALNIISSPGAGKTLLLERTLEALRGELPCAVITGDQQTDNDARRLRGKGAPVVQIETRSSCHLDAQQVGRRLAALLAEGERLLFIENVGNLVCPAAFDLGEQAKVALLSVTEGEEKPLKYPVLFHAARVCLVTKIDLLPHLDLDMGRMRANLLAVQPQLQIVELSAKTGEGMGSWLKLLRSSAQAGANLDK